MFQCKLYNMCMIYEPQGNRVLVQDKIPVNGWGGITFPGGHVEPGESFVDSVIREVREETGLTVSQLEYAGVIHYYTPEERIQWICFLYKSCRYTGQLVEETEEGRVFWADRDQLPSMALAPNMEQYLQVFSGRSLEAFALYGAGITDPLALV